jgi:hypothetical protein
MYEIGAKRMKKIAFPQVSGRNLKRIKHVFPQDFPAKYTIVLIAFWRHQQNHIDTWLPFVTKLEEQYQNMAYVEFPVIYEMGSVRQFLLNEGMRAGIPDEKARERTITLYLDKPRFLNHFGIASEEEIQIMLVGDDGDVLWRETGLFSIEKGEALHQILLQENQLVTKG